MAYSEAFKAKMVQKLAGPNGRSAMSLGGEVGVHPSTLSRWFLEAGTVRNMAKSRKTKKQASEKQIGTKRPQDWRPEEKLQVVLEAASLAEEDLGGFLRSKGLHQAQLDEWRELVTKAALDNLGGSRRSRKASPEAKRIRELEKELRRKDKALAETAALLVLKKKVDAIWGDVDDDTDPRNGR
jgi:transposase